MDAFTTAALREAEADATLADVRRNFAALTEVAARQRDRVAELEAQIDALKLKIEKQASIERYMGRCWTDASKQRDEARKELATARDLVTAVERSRAVLLKERDALRAQLELHEAADPEARELHRARQCAARWKALARRLRRTALPRLEPKARVKFIPEEK